jgi:hypothetical protein
MERVGEFSLQHGPSLELLAVPMSSMTADSVFKLESDTIR